MSNPVARGEAAVGASSQPASGRKRAAKACLACRARKVRCDVALCGQPCTHCSIDGKNCLVVGRASRLANDRRARDRRATKGSPEHREQAARLLATSLDSSEPSDDFSADLLDREVLPPRSVGEPSPELAASPGRPSNRDRDSSSDAWFHQRAASRTSPRPAMVLYSHLPFLAVGNIHRIPFQDVNYLEAQGCLHVPTRPMLDNFVEQYFLHVHPLLPLLDEGDFWDMYSQVDAPCPESEKMSLVLFQAMLYSSCTFVPFEVVRELGFSSLRDVRAEFYRHARLLYDLDTETANLPLAQAALLLMSWVPPSNLASNPYRTWLGHALQHARSINADRCGSTVELPATANPGAKRHKRACRRLWWCCVVFDRISPMCTRFKPRITRDTFDFAGATPLGMQDLEGEIYRSSVYSPAAKRRLIGLFELYLEFLLLLTDVLALMFPFEDSLRAKYLPPEEDGTHIEACDAALEAWFARASARFPPSEGPSSVADSVKTQDLHRSEVLHVNLIYVYYYTSKIALHHSRVLYLVAHGQHSGFPAVLQTSELEHSRRELMHAATHMTLLFGELTRRRLARWLPISAIACIAMPLALNVISARLSSVSNELAFDRSSSALGSKTNQQQGLDVLIEAMKAFLPQYEGVEWVREAAKYAANLAQADSQVTTALMHDTGSSSPSTITDWTQILAVHPGSYIRTTMAVDLCISKGRVPQDDDFPAWLFSRLSLDTGAESAARVTGDVSKQHPAAASVPNVPFASSAPKMRQRGASTGGGGSPGVPPGPVSGLSPLPPPTPTKTTYGEQRTGEDDGPQSCFGLPGATLSLSDVNAASFAELDSDRASASVQCLGYGIEDSALHDRGGLDWSFAELLGLGQ